MEKIKLAEELQKILDEGTGIVQREIDWVDSFVNYAIDSIDINEEQSEASQAVSIFINLCRDAGLWEENVTPLSLRRKRKKEGKEEDARLTMFCRLEGRIRDMFRKPTRRASNNGDDSNSNSASNNGDDSNSNSNSASNNGDDSNSNSASNSASNNGDDISKATDEEKRRYRLEGKLVILLAFKRWAESRKTVSKKVLLEEIERVVEELQQDQAA